MPQLLIEFFSEEIPARMQDRAAEDLQRLLDAALAEANLAHEGVVTERTPRRLVAVVDGLPAAQPDRSSERKGPRTDAPQKAIDGFLGATGLTLDQCQIREDKKGAYYVAVIEEKGRPAAEVLSEIVVKVARELPWQKSMRWGRTGFRWVRPLHAILAVFDGRPLPGGLDISGGEIAFGAETRGHRFLHPGTITVTGYEDYREQLRAAFVLIRYDERKSRIREGLEAVCREHALSLQEDEGLLGEVTGLVEWPVVLTGEIDAVYMDLPDVVLRTSMREHQKYFALRGADGALASRFAFVSNLQTDDPSAIVAGNERVLRARLADARYFWDHDRATPLAERVGALDRIVFHAKLGSVGDKVRRIEALASWLAEHVLDADPAVAARAARLAKADLVSGMVGEFPELQGMMGRFYAEQQGEDPAVSQAIGEHYSPAGPNDGCPAAPVSVAVALADKLDTLAGFWSIDEKPTGSKDPFALRRAALGVIRLVLENGLRLKLGAALVQAGSAYPDAPDGMEADLLSFFADRMKVHLREQGVRHDQISAVFALEGEDDLLRIVARARALGAFLASEDGANLLTAYRRAANIVRAEEAKDGTVFDGAAYDPETGHGERAEEQVWTALSESEAALAAALEDERFEEAMTLLSHLRAPVDGFFDAVTVNADDPVLRANRLRLLARIQKVMNDVADFSQIEG